LLKHCTTSRKVACSIPDAGINHSGRTMALESTHSLTEMSTRSIFWENKDGRCIGLKTLPPSCADCSKLVNYIDIFVTAIGLTPGGSSTISIYTQTLHRTIQNKQYIEQHMEKCGPCPVLASYTLAFALQLRKKHGNTSVKVAASKNT